MACVSEVSFNNVWELMESQKKKETSFVLEQYF